MSQEEESDKGRELQGREDREQNAGGEPKQVVLQMIHL